MTIDTADVTIDVRYNRYQSVCAWLETRYHPAVDIPERGVSRSGSVKLAGQNVRKNCRKTIASLKHFSIHYGGEKILGRMSAPQLIKETCFLTRS